MSINSSASRKEILGFKSSRILRVQREIVRLWHEREGRIAVWEDACRELPLLKGTLTEIVSSIVRINAYQWHEEDKARATDASDGVIAQVKRNIDPSNQRRVNEIERLDMALESSLKKLGFLQDERTPLNSETPASIVDRLSILVLKLYHMEEQSRRKDLTPEQRRKFSGRLDVLHDQMKDLSACLDRLMKDILEKKRRFKTTYQFKMYNDPETNPYIKGPARG